MIRKEATICLENGLEARPVALLVQVASRFESDIYLEHGDKKVNAKSIMGMMTMVLTAGDSVNVTANGNDENDAVDAIVSYLSGESK